MLKIQNPFRNKQKDNRVTIEILKEDALAFGAYMQVIKTTDTAIAFSRFIDAFNSVNRDAITLSQKVLELTEEVKGYRKTAKADYIR